MRYGFMQRTMWFAFSSSFKEAVKTVLDESDANDMEEMNNTNFTREFTLAASGP